MISTSNRSRNALAVVLLFCVFCALSSPGVSQEPVIIQPGAPGEPSRDITAEEAADLTGIDFTAADVEFMQGMIGHHAQALEMTALLETRSQRDEMHTLAKRISLSQDDEIRMMQNWLRQNGQDVPEIGEHAHHGMMMPGMLTGEQMAQLEAASGTEFDRLFLELMIEHHRGALVMVEDLLETPGAAQESVIFGFTADVTSDQSAEMDRMAALLASLSDDPRVGLTAGFRDAGEALWNMKLAAAVPKPPGFFNPDRPEGVAIPDEMPEDEDDEDGPSPSGSEEGETQPSDAEGEQSAESADPEDEKKKAEAELRARMRALLNYANSDLAFAGDIVFEGNFHGFNTYNIEDPTSPRLRGSVVCPGGQGDVSVVGDLLIMSVEQTRGRLDCGRQGVAEPVSSERFRGVRIFDISDIGRPQQLAAVQTCRGSHTHSVVSGPDENGNLYVYGSGTSSVRSGDELAGCSDAEPHEDENTALFSIDVIEIPVDRPQDARVVNRPRIFADAETGAIAGLWEGGNHGRGTQKTRQTDQCHDITVFPDLGLAAGACSGNGILLDISDPVNPKRLDQVTDETFAYWHSATFNNDGTKVLFTDEWGGGMRPRCRSADPKNWGANAIFDIVAGKMEFRGYYKLPAPQTEQENCVAHNGSLVPVPGRDIMVQAWYQGGISVFDFTDSARPQEIAYFDRGPIDGEELLMGGHWSAYWYRGFIYGTEIARGLDVLELTPSEYLSENELQAAALIEPEEVNAQQQHGIVWPSVPVVAKAYLDQLDRSRALAAATSEQLRDELDRAGQVLKSGNTGSTRAGRIASQLEEIATQVSETEVSVRDRTRLERLVETTRGIAESLR